MKTWSFAFLFAAVSIFSVDHFILESIHVPSSSMYPTIRSNERLHVQRAWYGPIQRYDVVVINSEAARHRIIKRIVGLPGECIVLKDSWQVVVDGHPLPYFRNENTEINEVVEDNHPISLRFSPHAFAVTKFGGTPLCLESDEYYALGDNRLATWDSRKFGPIKRSEIQGKAKWVWLSVDRAQRSVRWSRILTRIE